MVNQQQCRFEVTWSAGLLHRGSPNLDDKLVGKAKSGEIVEGVVTSDGMWLHCENDIFIPIKSAKGKALMKPVGAPSGSSFANFSVDGRNSFSAPLESGDVGNKNSANELDTLHAMGDEKFGRKRAAPVQLSGGSSSSRNGSKTGPGYGSNARRPAAQSHVANEQYMHEFEAGLKEMGATNTHLNPHLHIQPVRDTSGVNGGYAGNDFKRAGAVTSASETRMLDQPRNSNFRTYAQSVKHGVDTVHESAGKSVDLSDRNILCMSVHRQKVVCGSADHSLKEVDIASMRVCRTLYTQRSGHTDWVTAVAHTSDGHVLSGGADNLLCLWPAGGAPNCVPLKGHTGSISRVEAADSIGISSSYDKSLRIWDLRSKRESATLVGHTAPILTFSWQNDRLVSGDRSGNAILWDVRSAEKIAPLKGHKGHITAIRGDASREGVFFTGAQDGHIRLWDTRVRKNRRNWPGHIGGAVNDIRVVGDTMVSVGADNRLLWTDLRKGFECDSDDHSEDFVNVVEEVSSDFVYSMTSTGRQVFLGDGHGNLSAYEIATGKLSWSFKACINAIRCLEIVSDNASVLCAGDDGNLQLFNQ